MIAFDKVCDLSFLLCQTNELQFIGQTNVAVQSMNFHTELLPLAKLFGYLYFIDLASSVLGVGAQMLNTCCK